MRIGKQWEFSASHHLPDHRGKCLRGHGHNYSVEVVLVGPAFRVSGESGNGMVVDYYVMDQIWKGIEEHLDHYDLNLTTGHVLFQITTAENLACYIFDRFKSQLEYNNSELFAQVYQVTVRETTKTFATAFVADWEEFKEWQKQQESSMGPSNFRSRPPLPPVPSLLINDE